MTRHPSTEGNDLRPGSVIIQEDIDHPDAPVKQKDAGAAQAKGYQDVKSDRSLNTSYQNNTGNPLEVKATVYVFDGGNLQTDMRIGTGASEIVVDQIDLVAQSGERFAGAVSAIVPDGGYYKVLEYNGGQIDEWFEQELA